MFRDYARRWRAIMELKHLRAFVALAEELHFGRAAQRLCIVQPALSMQIKALEEELDVRLLERDRHKVALSETGRLFLPEARATLHQAMRAEQTARLSARGEIGTLRIAFVSSVLPKLLPTLIRMMHARYPLVTLELKDMPTPDQIAALQDNKLDFGLIRLPVAGTGLQIRTVLEEPFVVALPDDHPLAAQEFDQTSRSPGLSGVRARAALCAGLSRRDAGRVEARGRRSEHRAGTR
jgi:DNA-binding transcriptional LysR family regulator